MKFIILGAGLSGLTSGAALQARGHEVILVEKGPEVGGLARSHRVNGCTFDYGPHFLFGERVHELLRERFAGINLEQLSGTKEKMYFKGKYFNFPFDPKNILLKMNKSKIPGVVFQLALKNIFKHGPARRSQDVEEWVIQAVGSRIYEYIALGDYIRKLYGIPPSRVSNEWGIQKLKFLARWQDSSLTTLIARSFSEGSAVKGRVIHYPPGGIDSIAGGIAESFRHSGGTILLSAEATSVRHRIDGITVVCNQNGSEIELKGDFLISTLPITRLVDILSPSPPSQISQDVKSLKYRTLILLFLFLGRNELLKHQCIYFPEDHYVFRRITEFKHLGPQMAPPGKTSLCVEITCFEGDAIWGKGQEELLHVVTEQLEGIGYLRREDMEGHQLQRIPFAYPVYELGYADVLDRVLNQLKSYPNMLSIGRQGLFFYNAMNSSILTSYELGEKLAQCRKEDWAAIVEETYESRKFKYFS